MYSIWTDTGSGTLTVFPINANNTVTCPTPNGTRQISFSSPNDSLLDQDFGIDAPLCTDMHVSIGASLFRPGRPTLISVNYCNYGILDADSVYV